jgi:competence protein ComEA
MNYLYLVNYVTRVLWPPGQLLSFRRLSAAWAMALALVLGGTLLAAPGSLQAQESGAASVATVNINTADAEALAAGLNGVGHSRAAEIVRYRETYGPFSSVDELAEVKGIGQSTLDKNRAVITLE